jgi:hypothetical protein
MERSGLTLTGTRREHLPLVVAAVRGLKGMAPCLGSSAPCDGPGRCVRHSEKCGARRPSPLRQGSTRNRRAARRRPERAQGPADVPPAVRHALQIAGVREGRASDPGCDWRRP